MTDPYQRQIAHSLAVLTEQLAAISPKAKTVKDEADERFMKSVLMELESSVMSRADFMKKYGLDESADRTFEIANRDSAK